MRNRNGGARKTQARWAFQAHGIMRLGVVPGRACAREEADVRKAIPGEDGIRAKKICARKNFQKIFKKGEKIIDTEHKSGKVATAISSKKQLENY